MILHRPFFTACLWILTISLGYSASLVIDDFSDAFTPDILLVTGTSRTASSSTTLTTSSVAGALRTSDLSIGSLDSLLVSAQIDPDGVTVSAGPSTNGNFTLTYDYRPASASGLDFTPFNVFRVLIPVSDTSVEPASTNFTFASLDGASATAVVDLNQSGFVDVPLTDWAGVDLSQITDVTIDWNIGNANDITISFLSVATSTDTSAAVPEPSFALIHLLVLAGAIARRRR